MRSWKVLHKFGGIRQGDPLSPYYLCFVWKSWGRKSRNLLIREFGRVSGFLDVVLSLLTYVLHMTSFYLEKLQKIRVGNGGDTA